MTKQTEHIEYDILQRLNKGESEAFIWLYDRYHSLLYNYIFHFVKSAPFAEDILQDVFMKIWEARNRISPERGAKAYFYRITRNTVYNFLSNMKRQKELENELLNIDENAEDINPSANEEHEQIELLLYKAINELPDKRKKIFKLCRQQGKSYEEVANEFGISRNTVKEHLVLALKFIKKRVKANIKNLQLLIVAYSLSKFM